MTPAKRRDAALSLPEYALKSSATNQLDKDPGELDYLRFGFFGEVGGLLSSVKRSVRDQLSESQSQLASEELGDALWYLFGVAKALQVSPDDLGVECIRELRKRAQDKDTTPMNIGVLRRIVCAGFTNFGFCLQNTPWLSEWIS